MSVLVERLKERLEACGTNASRASLETGFGRQCIRDVLMGKSKSPSVAFVAAAARVLNCSVAYLVGEVDEPGSAPDYSFGAIIRRARAAKGMTQTEFADAVGTSQGRVSGWESDHEFPSGISLLKISGVLGIDLPVHAATTAIPSENIPSRTTKPTVGALPKLTDLRDEIETAYDMMTALDKAGDGIGGDVGNGVSAVALAARAALDNARDMIRAMEAAR